MRWIPATCSEAFDPGAQVDLLRPGGAVLTMEVEIDLGDRVGRKAAVRQATVVIARRRLADLAVDDDVRDMDTARAELSRHALRQRTQGKLRGCEVGEVGPAPQGRGRARKQDRAGPVGYHSPGSRLPDQEAGKRANTPAMLEIIWRDVEDRPWPIRAGVEYRAYERPETPLGLLEGSADLGRIGHVARYRDQAVWSLRGHGTLGNRSMLQVKQTELEALANSLPNSKHRNNLLTALRGAVKFAKKDLPHLPDLMTDIKNGKPPRVLPDPLTRLRHFICKTSVTSASCRRCPGVVTRAARRSWFHRGCY